MAKAFGASWGPRTKLYRIDAGLTARFTVFRPEAGRALSNEQLRPLRALASKRGQLIETQAAPGVDKAARKARNGRFVRGKCSIGSGRRLLRHVMFQAALIAAHRNPVLKPFADRLRKAGRPCKVFIISAARKRMAIVNPLCISRQKGASQPF
ncbi:IS110 family transposase [Leisingera thetidis]|uniref:IS110 family transposase n=1 Tax=Leisingera thetidis TaxID=2930199 RepID=UPI0021F7AA02|nr:IS110 family transposase [Leisingera thetidis]